MKPLPPFLTRFVERHALIADIAARLRVPGLRLLTLIGTGGAGKTRAAVRVAETETDRFRDGALFVDFSLLPLDADAAALWSQIALCVEPLGSGDDAVRTRDFLRDKTALVIFDNCEQVVPAISFVAAELLRDAPGITLLATSRSPLAVPGETLFPLPTAPVAESAALFADRARAVRPDFALTEANTAVVDAICARLDYLPLAVELAAARLASMTVAELLRRLETALPQTLTRGAVTLPARQQTLRGTIAWSEALLSENERRLFARLSVFEGGWFADMARAVSVGDGTGDAADDAAADDALVALVGHSLVAVADDPAGNTRYRFLQTVRAYATEKRAADPQNEAAALAARTRWAVNLSEAINGGIWGKRGGEWMNRGLLERDNLRAALETAPPVDALTIAANLTQFWWRRGAFAEGLAWSEAALARAESYNGTLVYLRQRTTSEQFKQLLGLPHETEVYLLKQIDFCRRSRNLPVLIPLLHTRAFLRRDAGDLNGAVAVMREGLALARTLVGDDWLVQYQLEGLGGLLLEADPLPDAAEEPLVEALILWNPVTQRTHFAITQRLLGEVRARQNRKKEAVSLLRQALTVFDEQAAVDQQIETLLVLARVGGDAADARRALALAREAGNVAGVRQAEGLLTAV